MYGLLTKRCRYWLTGVLVALVVLLASTATGTEARPGGSNGSQGGQTPENIIVMVADGMGYNHVDVASMWQHGKSRYQRIDGGHPQRVPSQVYQRFPVQFPMETTYVFGEYDPDRAWSEFDYVTYMVTDSAAAATAMSTGVKTRNWLGLDRDGNPLPHIKDRAQELGKSTGVVTTAQFPHATPAGFVVHQEDRRAYPEIADEMILDSGLDVIMGTGHPWYDNAGDRKSSPFFRNIDPELWEAMNAGEGEAGTWTVVDERSDFRSLAEGSTPERVFGIPQTDGTLQHDRPGDNRETPFGDPLIENVPTLSEMSRGALNTLDNASDEGMFLMIEAATVDHAGHANELGRTIEEMVAFNEAVEEVNDWVESESSWRETMVIVTADHETGYLLGPGSDPERKPVVNNGRGELPGVSWNSDYHTNQLVPFYAKGAGSKNFRSYATQRDPVLGRYIDLTNIAHVTFDMWGRPAPK